MNLGKSARYALYAAVEMARSQERLVTAGDVARQYRIPEGALAKVFQTLVRARIAAGTRGVGGGYRLARPPSKLSVLELIQLFDPPRAPGSCLLAAPGEGPCPLLGACRIHRLLDEVDELARCTFASVSLATLAGAPSPLAGIGAAGRA